MPGPRVRSEVEGVASQYDDNGDHYRDVPYYGRSRPLPVIAEQRKRSSTRYEYPIPRSERRHDLKKK
jgi:hypothetical protein